MSHDHAIKSEHVRSAYARWAPIYDVIASPTIPARKIVAQRVNDIGGHFLEAGIGSGSALELYGESVSLVGVDLSHDMLRKARERVDRGLRAKVDAIVEMNLMHLGFADATFDGVVCMFTITAVPEPAQVLSEFARVVKPGGTVIVASHFAADAGPWRATDAMLTPFAKRLGWNPSMPLERVLGVRGLTLSEQTSLPPAGLITLLRFTRDG